jgi:hypothetical protein
MEYRKIEIDFDIHRLIENERRGFAESENAALRRLLKLSASPQAKSDPGTGKPWVSGKVQLPHGTELRLIYNGTVYEGRIENGKWVVEGETFSTPSGAAGIAKTKKGGSAMLNGWESWQVKRPEDAHLIALKSLR